MSLHFEGHGSKVEPYLIYTEEDLRCFATYVNEGHSEQNEYFALEKDLVLSDEEWIPIGTGELDHSVFKGIFDGRGHEISGIKIGTRIKPNGSMKTVGLFGVVASSSGEPAVIQNLQVNVEIYSKLKFAYLGGVAGVIYNKTMIENCFIEGTLEGGKGTNEQSGNFPIIGGLVGINSYEAIVINSHSEALVAGGYYAVIGGLVGWNMEGKVKNSTSIGKIIGSDFSVLGGLVGYNSHRNSIISNSFSGAKVIAGNSASLGGLVGWNTDASIKNSHGLGAVMGDSDAIIGGLVGWNTEGKIISCCWNKEAIHMVNGDFIEDDLKKGVLCFDENFKDTSKAISLEEIKKIVKGRIIK